ALIPSGQAGLDRRDQTFRVPSGLGGDVHPRGPGHPGQLPVDLFFQVDATLLVEKVPLVEGQNQATPGIHDLLDHTDVLLGEWFADIHQDHRDLGPCQGVSGTHRCVVVGALQSPVTATNTGGVDELPGLPAQFDDFVDGIAGGACHRVHHDPFLTGEPVEQTGLAHVGTAQPCDTGRTVLLARTHRFFGEGGHDGVQQVTGPPPVQGTDRVRLSHTQVPQFQRLGLLLFTVDLVGGEHDRTLGAAQHPGDGLVGVGGADGGVHHEQDHVGGLGRVLGLSGHHRGQTTDTGLPSTGVHQGEGDVLPFGVVGDPVTSHPRNILHHGLSAAQDSVEQAGLAHVGAADHGHHGKLYVLFFTVDHVGHVELTHVLLPVLGPRAPRMRAARMRKSGVGRYDRPLPRCHSAAATGPRALSTSATINAMTSSRLKPVVSSSVASSVCVKGDTVRLESSSSRRARSAWVAATSPVRNSLLRRCARASAEAVKNSFTGASGATTVVMSRPSTTIPALLRVASSMIARCVRTSSSRASGTAETALTFAVTSGPRISADTSRSSTATAGASGSVPITRVGRATTEETAAVSSTSTPLVNIHHVRARYIAPVSRYCRPNALATPLEVLDLPDPEGPSIATTTPSVLPCAFTAVDSPWW